MKKKIKAKKKTVKKVVKKAVKKKSKVKLKAKPKAKLKSAIKLKVAGQIEHFFGHILVAAMKLKNPLAVGDVIHVKGHTTDFVQRIDSMQIDHASVQKAKKGQDVGFKVKDKVRAGDTVFFAAKESVLPKVMGQQTLIPTVSTPILKPMIAPIIAKPQSKPTGGYESKKFLSF